MFFEALKISSDFLFFLLIIYTWVVFIVKVLGENGVMFFLSILTLIIFSSFPLYLLEYILTLTEFEGSVSGTIFLVSSCSYIVLIIGAFLFHKMFKKDHSLFDSILQRYYKKIS